MWRDDPFTIHAGTDTLVCFYPSRSGEQPEAAAMKLQDVNRWARRLGCHQQVTEDSQPTESTATANALFI